MRAVETHISYEKQGRYFSYGDPNKATKLIIAMHGYGQLAEYFIRKFHLLDPTEYFIICPEGAHRFYLNGTSGRVGASWMTKVDRETDINNQLAFLNTLSQEIMNEHDFSTKVLLGFSQGGATASRWVVNTNIKFDQFILWAAVFPPDMDVQKLGLFHHMKCFFVVGNKDEYISPERAEEMQMELSNKDLPFEMIIFEGTHTIEFNTLKNIVL